MEVQVRKGGRHHHRTKVSKEQESITNRFDGKVTKSYQQVRHLPPVEKPLPLPDGGIIGGERQDISNRVADIESVLACQKSRSEYIINLMKSSNHENHSLQSTMTTQESASVAGSSLLSHWVS